METLSWKNKLSIYCSLWYNDFILNYDGMRLFEEQAAIEHSKRRLITLALTLCHAKLENLIAQENINQEKRRTINKLYSWFEKADDMSRPEHQEKRDYNRKLLLKYYPSENAFRTEITYLSYDIPTSYIDQLKLSLQKIRNFNEAGQVENMLSYNHFFIEINNFNVTYNAALDESSLSIQELDFRRALNDFNLIKRPVFIPQTFPLEELDNRLESFTSLRNWAPQHLRAPSI